MSTQSTNSSNSSSSNGGVLSPEQYAEMMAKIEAFEKHNQALLKQEQDIIKTINDDEEQISSNKSWIKSHDHWYYFGWYDGDIWDKEQQDDALQSAINGLQGQLKNVEKQLDKMDEEIAAPIAMLDLKVQKIFKELSSGSKITSAMLQDVMQLMAEVMALVQVILADVDNKKGQQESRMSKTEIFSNKRAMADTHNQIDEMRLAAKTAKIMGIVGKVIEAIVVVASVLIAAATGGTCAFLVAVAVGAFMLSGGMQDLTDAIAKALPPGSGFKILADVISTAIVVVATLGVGAAVAGVEAGMQAALTNAVKTVVSDVVDDVVSSVVEDVVENVMESVSSDIAEDVSEGAVKDAAEGGVKTVAQSVAKEVAEVASKNAIRSVLRQSLIGTLKQGLTSTTKEAVETGVREAVQEALTNATGVMESAGTFSARAAMGDITQDLADSMVQNLTKQATEVAVKMASADALSASGVNFTQAAKMGAAVGFFGTNTLPDTLQPLIEKIFGKNSKMAEILMDIIKVLNAILGLVVMAKAGGMTAEATDGVEAELTKTMRGLQNAARMAQVGGGILEGITLGVKGSTLNEQADATKGIGKNDEIMTIMNLLLKELNELTQGEQKQQSKAMKTETDTTLETINKLSAGMEGYANALRSTAV